MMTIVAREGASERERGREGWREKAGGGGVRYLG